MVVMTKSQNALAAVLGGGDAAGSIFVVTNHLLFYHYQTLNNTKVRQ